MSHIWVRSPYPGPVATEYINSDTITRLQIRKVDLSSTGQWVGRWCVIATTVNGVDIEVFRPQETMDTADVVACDSWLKDYIQQANG